jgi:hypothetical protein
LSGFCCIYATWEFTHKGADVQQNQSYEVRLCLQFYFRGDRRIAAQIITLDDNLRRNPQQSTPLHSAFNRTSAIRDIRSRQLLYPPIFAHLFAQGGWGVVIVVLKELDKV